MSGFPVTQKRIVVVALVSVVAVAVLTAIAAIATAAAIGAVTTTAAAVAGLASVDGPDCCVSRNVSDITGGGSVLRWFVYIRMSVYIRLFVYQW